MRAISSVLPLLLVIACSKNEPGITMLSDTRTVDVPAPVSATATHRCQSAAENGSAAQVACFEAAKASCPQGTGPDQVMFRQEADGRFVIEGYGCA